MRRGPKTSTPKPKTEVLELDVTDLAPGGHGVALAEKRGERRAVFVRASAVGDRVRAEVDFASRPARARTLEILTRSADRKAPADVPCRFLEKCGACDFMHLTHDAQVRAHVSFVRAHLPDAFADFPIDSVVAPEGARTRYRERARVHVETKGRGVVSCGMFAAGTREPVAVDSCEVLSEDLDRVRAWLPELLAEARGSGEVHLARAARQGADPTTPEGCAGSTGNTNVLPVLTLEWRGDPLPGSVFARAEAAVRDGRLAGLAFVTAGAKTPAEVGRPAPVSTGADGRPLVLPLAGFAQAHGKTNESLAHAVAHETYRLLTDGAGNTHVPRATGEKNDASSPAALPTLAPELALPGVVELYSGSGNLTVLLARFARELVAVESVGPACDAARSNLTARGLSARVVNTDAETYAWPKSTRVLVLDPPRTGARAVAETIARAPKLHGIVMVSCDPATLGRDLAILAPHYEPVRITTFEMFPETSHVETLVVLRKKAR